MEWMFSKNLRMFRGHKKYIVNLCFLMLIISDCCWSISPQQLNEHGVKDILSDIPTPITTDTTPKPKCIRTFIDGTQIPSHECSSGLLKNEHSTKNTTSLTLGNQTSDLSKETSTNEGNTNISSPNVTSINTAKHVCNNTLLESSKRTNCDVQTPEPKKLTTTINASKENNTDGNSSITTESAEIASMNDHSNKYTGGLDVDEKLNISNKDKFMNSTSASNHTIPSNGTDQKRNKVEGKGDNSNISQPKNNDSISKRLFSTKAAGIAAGLCVTVASLAYISLMVWKKISYKRYGNREMLLNEDDLGDIHDEDMRHFEAACIQIET